MNKNFFAFLTLGLVAVLAVTGCKPKRNVPVTKFPAGATGAGTGTGTGAGTGADVGGTATTPPGVTGANIGGAPLNPLEMPDPKGLEGMTPDREIFKANTVYFEFDSAVVRAGEQAKIAAVAKVLAERSSTKVQIEGHCDERGTEEYNRGLGERRALAIRDALLQAGIAGTRVFTISFGEDKPAVAGHNEAAWAKNRRGEFILYLPKP